MAFAADAPPGASLPIFKVLAALGVVLGLMLLLYAATKRGVRFFPKTRQGAIRVVETRALGGRKFLCLVQVRGEEFLLGVGGDRIDFLTRTSHRPKEFDQELRQNPGGAE